MKVSVVLIDYDNAVSERELSPFSAEFNLSTLLSSIAPAVATTFPGCQDITARLYGGWVYRDRQYSQRALWLLPVLANYRKRFGSVRVRASLAEGLLCLTDHILAGTYHEGRQKMVDGMITMDLAQLALENRSFLALVSDDEDFVPGLLWSARQREPRSQIAVLRRRKIAGQSPNDWLLKRNNIAVIPY